jgi:VCBS repeat-containing protein
VDDGEDAFTAPAPAALQGVYGAFSFNAATGAWSYALDNAAADSLNEGDSVEETLTVTSLDGTATETITVTITGSNDAATITGTNTDSVTEAGTAGPGDPSASGQLTVSDVDDGEAAFTAPTPVALQGAYGAFSFNAATGAWSYALNNSNPAVQALNNGQTLTDSLLVSSADGTDSETITVTINGANDYTPPPVYQGPNSGPGSDPNNFDSLGNAAGTNISGSDDSRLNEVIHGGAGNDVINGNNGNDTIYGGSGNDHLNGNNHVDTLYGGSGNDTVDGGNAADVIVGGFGADRLTGGGGGDVFRFLDARDTGDLITDFSSVEGDKIDFAALHSGTLGFTAGATMSTTANSVNWWHDTVNNQTVVSVDVTGDTTADFEVRLTGVIALTASDFIL